MRGRLSQVLVVRAWIRRRALLILALMIGGLIFFFPSLHREEVILEVVLPGDTCGSRVLARVSQAEKNVRRLALAVRSARLLSHSMDLARGDYHVEVELECDSGEIVRRAARDLAVDRASTRVAFEL